MPRNPNTTRTVLGENGRRRAEYLREKSSDQPVYGKWTALRDDDKATRAREFIAAAEIALFGREIGKPDVKGITLRRALQQRDWRKKRLSARAAGR